MRNTPGVIEDDLHEIFVVVDELAVSTVNLKVYFWVETFEYRRRALEVKSDVALNVKNAIVKHGFNLPADITEIKLYGSQTSIPVEIRNEKK